MKLWNWIRNKITNKKSVYLNDPTLLEWLGIDPDTPKDRLSEVTYFACLKILSESIGKLPLKMYQNTDRGIIKASGSEEYELLKTRPNPLMTSTVFWSTLEMNRNHYGNGYAWLRFGNGRLLDAWIMQSQYVTVLVDDAGIFGNENGIWYRYSDPHTGKQYVFSNEEVIHVKTSHTFDGLVGKPVQDILKHTVEGNLESQKYLNNLYKSGLTGKAVLEYTGDLDEEAVERLRKGFERFANGSDNAGKIIPVPLGMKLVPLDIKLTDSQFFELRKYSALQIAAAFGIKPTQINDYEKSSYASAEAQNLAFYTDTLLWILKQYEEEITYKCLSTSKRNEGYHFKFNVNVILRADMKTQMEALSKGVNNGIYTPNEAREYLDLPAKEGGDQLVMNGNYIPLTMVGEQYKGGD